jgi:hypothetical protein
VQAQLRLVHVFEDGLGGEDVEVGRQLERRAEALDEGHGAGEWPGHPEPPGRPALEGEERPDNEAEHLGEEPGIPGALARQTPTGPTGTPRTCWRSSLARSCQPEVVWSR